MKDIRNAVLFTSRIGENLVEFNSNGRRIKRRITSQEVVVLSELLKNKDYMQIDSFCFKIV